MVCCDGSGVKEVRRNVDLKALNDNVLCEVHPIPKVDETLAQLAGATIFSKLDANCGFLANTTIGRFLTVDHICDTQRALLFQ